MGIKMRSFPKTELHVHLDGTLSPALVRQLAEEQCESVKLDPSIFTADQKKFSWKTFSDIHHVFEEFFKVIRTSAHYALITYSYLKKLAEQNCVYVELIVSPFHAEQNGLSYEEMLIGVVAGIEKARKAFGIECRMLMAM